MSTRILNRAGVLKALGRSRRSSPRHELGVAWLQGRIRDELAKETLS
jgi:hypothetical protein